MLGLAAARAPRVSIPPSVLADIHGSAWLSSWEVAGSVAVGSLVAAAFLLVFSRLRRRTRSGARRPARVGTVLRSGAAAVLVLLASAAIANAYVGYVPNLAAGGRLLTSSPTASTAPHVPAGQAAARSSSAGPASSTGPASPAVASPVPASPTSPASTTGAVSTITLPADAAATVPASTAWVYTPPGYDAKAGPRYPVVYLVHGYPGTSADWFAGGQADHVMDVLLASHLVRPMILVSIDVNGGGIRDTECLDAVHGPKIESWIYGTVLPYMDSAYRTIPGRHGRMLGGMSSGGFCALDQGLRHQDVWGGVLAFEPYGDPGRGGRVAFEGNQAAFRAHSPTAYLPSTTFSHPMPVYLDVGSENGVNRVRRLAQDLQARDHPVQFRINPGQGHNWTEVQVGVPYALVFASNNLPAVQHSTPS
ncbi:MAG: alpha/beta hydrolase [Actinomycetes bacterium]